ncbi:J domain-containing protein [Halogeometricum borinquense]|uniref:J domain-containing protein n=1 Tax=Halogeometricum borinquense TaxID=60847 RepID=UPI00342234C4
MSKSDKYTPYKALFNDEDEEAFHRLKEDLGGVSNTDCFRRNVRTLDNPALREIAEDFEVESPHEAVIALAERYLEGKNQIVLSSNEGEAGLLVAASGEGMLELDRNTLNDLRFGHGLSIPIEAIDDWNSLVKVDKLTRLAVTEAHVNYESSGTIKSKRVRRLIVKAWHPTDVDSYLRVFADCADVYPHPGADNRIIGDVDEYRLRAIGEDPAETKVKYLTDSKRRFLNRPLKDFLDPVWEIIGQHQLWYTDRDMYLSDLWRIIRLVFHKRSRMERGEPPIGYMTTYFQVPAIDVLIERLIEVLEHEADISRLNIKGLEIAADQLRRGAKSDFREWWPEIENRVHSDLIQDVVETPIPVEEAREHLGIKPDATLDEITSAYASQVKKVHPDHGGDGDNDLFERLKDAKKTLHIIHGQSVNPDTFFSKKVTASSHRIESAETIEERALAKLESGESLSDLSQEERDAVAASNSIDKRNSGEGTRNSAEMPQGTLIRGLPKED